VIHQVQDRIKRDCPEVKWIANYAVLGPCDYIDIFEAPNSEAATKVALLVRSFGTATTETWIVTPWKTARGNLPRSQTARRKREVAELV
jgi:uncharacterized protein with GYD domain